MASKRTRKEFEADLQAQQSPFVFYGTPLPPLDPEVRDDGSYVPVWQQEVRDERGSKRLHGAFTGGFSAGYFNTVGSKEGWTPQAFVSSRTSRAKDGKAVPPQQQRPEDFMDDEDLAEAAEAQTLQTNASFAGIGTTAQDEQHQGSFMDIFKPKTETMGVKLLRKMGWRDGQGIGPKVRRRANVGEADDGSDQKQHMFAPSNSRMIGFNRKDDRKGLGHQGEASLGANRNAEPAAEESDGEEITSASLIKSRVKSKLAKQKGVKQKGAFGVGVLNDDGSDDDDPYSMGPRIAYNKTIGADKPSKPNVPKQATVVKATPKSTQKNKLLASNTQKPPKQQRKCHDGKAPLSGFVLAERLASLSLGDDEKYALPKVPEGWEARGKETSDAVDASEYRTTGEAAKASTLDAKGRAALLGEAQLPGKSVFDFMSPAMRDRLATASNRNDLPPARNELIPSGKEQESHDEAPEIPHLDKRTAQEALRRNAPASLRNADDAKRSRYEDFLQYRAELSNEPPQPGIAVSNASWGRELDEFVTAAKAFKPMSGLMASRFTSAGVSKPTDDSLKQELTSRAAKPKDSAEEAAAMGMYGPMTRSQRQFFPTRLVCKRFGVKEPPHVQDEGRNQPAMTASFSSIPSSSGRPTSELLSDKALEQMKSEMSLPLTGGLGAQTADVPTAAQPSKLSEATNVSSKQNQAALSELVEVDTSRNDALEAERAGEEVFKAIFGGDNDDSD